jgi:hypothetical protein
MLRKGGRSIPITVGEHSLLKDRRNHPILQTHDRIGTVFGIAGFWKALILTPKTFAGVTSNRRMRRHKSLVPALTRP